METTGKTRQLTFPKDFDLLRDLFERGYFHRNHPDWDTEEEMRPLIDKIDTVKSLWPFFRPFIPAMPRYFVAIVWEEGQVPAGAVSALLQSTATKTYIVSSIVVLPEYRHKRAEIMLMQEMEALLQRLGADKATATVISENTPVLRLSKRYGAEEFNRHDDLLLSAAEPLDGTAELPSNYTITPVKGRDWDQLIAFMERLFPASVQKFEPVKKEDYRPSLLMRIASDLFNRMSGFAPLYQAIWHNESEIVGYVYWNLRRGKAGYNHLTIRISPEHEEVLVAPVLDYSLRKIRAASPDHDITMDVPAWQSHLKEAAAKARFVKRREWVHLGRVF
jgi:ribosomal protein S18 acetylase RimI-like enzyme